jgi:catechol 2,3-dioxygenase-like lactoylglutathione lyase family enzyme
MRPSRDPASGTDPAPRIDGVLETSLYVADLDRAHRFYAELFGLPTLFADDRMAALEVPGRQVLLLFKAGGSLDIQLPDGGLPPHDGRGELHFALSIREEDLERWKQRLGAQGIPIELEKRWPRGGTSLYFRDPDRHLAELATPGLWWPR